MKYPIVQSCYYSLDCTKESSHENFILQSSDFKRATYNNRNINKQGHTHNLRNVKFLGYFVRSNK